MGGAELSNTNARESSSQVSGENVHWAYWIGVCLTPKLESIEQQVDLDFLAAADLAPHRQVRLLETGAAQVL
jgi:hypothetical protein